jgi:signal transduction histidine kinase
VPGPLRKLLVPASAGLTYRRYVHLLLGAVLLLPYISLVGLFAQSITVGGLDPFVFVLLVVPATAAAVGVVLVPGVRALEITAARALLDADIPEPDPATADSWPARRRALLWLLINLAVGGLTALVTLFVLPVAVGFLAAPWREFPPFPTGLAAAWMPPAGLLLPVLLLHAVSAGGAALARLAPRILGPSRTEQLAVELARVQSAERALAERNRLARELHDSVGHALTVTTLQAGAAARVLDTDPAFVARALDAIAEVGRAALEDLDHVLGLLRDGGEGARGPQPGLADLDVLLDRARATGLVVAVERQGPLAAVPRAVSLEAYRIVQEALTNALRHAGQVPVTVRVTADESAVELEVTNPLGAGGGRARVGGRGLAGMRERVSVLRGELAAGPAGGDWRVAARLPLPMIGSRPGTEMMSP